MTMLVNMIFTYSHQWWAMVYLIRTLLQTSLRWWLKRPLSMQELVTKRSLSARLSHALDDLVVDVLDVLDALAGQQAIPVCQIVLMFLMIL